MERKNCINHLPNTYFVELREDYIQLCQTLPKRDKSKSSAHCKAFILAVMEHWTNYLISKKKPLYVSMTYPQWVKSMFGIFGHCCIMDSLIELAKENLLLREKHKAKEGRRDSYKYLLNIIEVNRRLGELQVTKESMHSPQKQQTSSVNYNDYLLSPEWAKRRQKALRFASFRCQVCNSNEGLNVHHRTYERLGHEHMGDMTVLCKNCHEIFHNNGELEG